ncbi:acetate uptake transporter [Geovibrio sp. ADMFC3]|jgi:succinate-acetate transporter protein
MAKQELTKQISPADAVSKKVSEAATFAETVIKDTTANPAPLGLMGFGLTTILLNLHNIGLFGLGSMILSMGIFYGGIAQIIAGIMEWKKKNTFGTVAFTSYGFFWITLVGLIVFPKFGFAEAPDATAMAAFLFFWGFFTLILFLGTFKMNYAMIAIFGSLTVLFFLLAVGDMTGNPTIKTIAGYEGIVCGALAVYTGAAQILNEIYGREVLPLGAFE